MACLNSRQGGCGCRMAAQNPRTTCYNGVSYAGMNYADAFHYRPCPHPFYCGPCGPVEPTCNCTAHCPPGSVPPPPGPSCPRPCATVYGYFSQTGSLVLDAGGIVPFSGPSSSTGITSGGGTATLGEAGVYMATLSVNVPANTTLSTTFSLQMNGANVPGGSIVVNKTGTDSPLHASTQTVFVVPANAVLRVISSEAVNLTADSASDPIVAVTIVRIG